MATSHSRLRKFQVGKKKTILVQICGCGSLSIRVDDRLIHNRFTKCKRNSIALDSKRYSWYRMKIDLWMSKLPLSECTLSKLQSYKHLSFLMKKERGIRQKQWVRGWKKESRRILEVGWGSSLVTGVIVQLDFRTGAVKPCVSLFLFFEQEAP